MSTDTLGANAPPEATERHLQSALTNDAIQALAVDFETAWATESVIYNGAAPPMKKPPRRAGVCVRS